MELVEMGARWYDPQIGRWLSPDTIIPDPTNPQSLNRYSYVYGNPLKFTDPSGHCPVCIVTAIVVGGYLAYRYLSQPDIAYAPTPEMAASELSPSDLPGNDFTAGDQFSRSINEAANYVNKDGTFSITTGVSASGFGAEGVTSLGLFHMDEKGNIAMGTVTGGGGGSTTLGVGVGGGVMGTNAADLSELGGFYANSGAVFPTGNKSVVIDHVGGKGKKGSINGINPSIAVGPQFKMDKGFEMWSQLPGAHSNINYTIPSAIFTSKVNQDGSRSNCLSIIGSCGLDTFDEGTTSSP